MNVSNQTTDQDQVKICLYKTTDNVDWWPVGSGVFTVAKGGTAPWMPPTGEALDKYTMKAFHPQFFDKELCWLNVGLNDNVAVRGGGGSYEIVVL